MKKYLLTLTSAAAILLACNDEQTKTTVTTQADSSSKPAVATTAPAKECYSQIKGKDTVLLSYTSSGNSVSGELSYNYFEKDKNAGTITGSFSGDTLIADYSFRSEGMTSVREVAFIKQGNTLVEGYGESEEKNGKSVFKNRSGLKFNNSAVLNKINCNKE